MKFHPEKDSEEIRSKLSVHIFFAYSCDTACDHNPGWLFGDEGDEANYPVRFPDYFKGHQP